MPPSALPTTAHPPPRHTPHAENHKRRDRRSLHFLEPTWSSSCRFYEDKPYCFVMMLTVVVYVGYLQVRACHSKLDVSQP